MAEDKRYVALDIHKYYVMVGAVNGEQAVVLPPHKVQIIDFDNWVAKHLRATDWVVMEATTNVWSLYDLLDPLVEQIIVAAPQHVKLVTQSYVKTDRRAVLTLAKLLSVKMADLVPPVWVPPQPARDLRALVRHRQALVADRSAAKNRLRSLLHGHRIVPPAGELFGAAQREWWENLPLSRTEKLRIRQLLSLIDQLTTMLDELEAELAQLSLDEPWAEQVPFLLQIPGFGLLTVMSLLGAIGDIGRFPTAKNLVGYAGLGVRLHDSGETRRTGHITKQGRKELRTALVEAAWMTVRYHPHWKAQFDALAARSGKHIAIVAIARKLLVLVWHVLTDRAADRHADPAAVARKFMKWASTHRLATSHGYSRTAFVQHHLQLIGLETGAT